MGFVLMLAVPLRLDQGGHRGDRGPRPRLGHSRDLAVNDDRSGRDRLGLCPPDPAFSGRIGVEEVMGAVGERDGLVVMQARVVVQ